MLALPDVLALHSFIMVLSTPWALFVSSHLWALLVSPSKVDDFRHFPPWSSIPALRAGLSWLPHSACHPCVPALSLHCGFHTTHYKLVVIVYVASRMSSIVSLASVFLCGCGAVFRRQSKQLQRPIGLVPLYCAGCCGGRPAGDRRLDDFLPGEASVRCGTNIRMCHVYLSPLPSDRACASGTSTRGTDSTDACDRFYTVALHSLASGSALSLSL